jgi:sugar lactone lactonase YvrE
MTWTTALVLLFVGCASMTKNPSTNVEVQTPKLVFTITEGISHPESVLYSPSADAIFVSNIASGNPLETKRLGNISKYNRDGKLISSPWVKGLKAPKGMAIVGNHLYVSDVNQVVKIDMKKARILQAVSVPGSKFLNDVTADKNGNVYISDMMTDTIFIWNKSGVKVWKKTPALRSPNGLYTDGSEHILMASWGNPIASNFSTTSPGALSALSLKDTAADFQEEKSFSGNLDGISADNHGNLWISDWMNGDIYKVQKNGSAQKVFNLKPGSADLSFSRELNLLLVPQMNESKVMAFKVD